MSLIQNPSGLPASGKFILCIWFRASAEAMAAAKAEVSGGARGPLLGIIPFMTWGTPAQLQGWATELVDVGVFPSHGVISYSTGEYIHTPTITINPTPDAELQEAALVFNGEFQPAEPSYIGIDCTGDFPVIGANINMGNDCALTGPFNTSKELTGDFNVYTGTPGGWVHPARHETDTYSGASPVLGHQMPQRFRLRGNNNDIDDGMGYAGGMTGQEVSAGVAHCLLFSVDFTDGVAVTGLVTDGNDPDLDVMGTMSERVSSACRAYLALDDRNQTEQDLSLFWPQGGGPNDILTTIGWAACASVQYQFTNTDPLNGSTATINNEQMDYSWSPVPIPFSEAAFGIPAAAAHSYGIKQIEVGRVQLFLGQSLDWGIEVNRRLFIDENGSPVDPAVAANVLGAPDINFQAADDWISGTNTGTAGNFTPTGRIDKAGDDFKLGQ